NGRDAVEIDVQGAPSAQSPPTQKAAIIVRGIVVNADGSPVIDTAGHLLRSNGRFDAHDSIAGSHTGVDGWFVVELPTLTENDRYQIVADHPDYAWGGRELTKYAIEDGSIDPNGLRITLLRPTTFTGILHTEDGTPAADVRVWPRAIRTGEREGIFM